MHRSLSVALAAAFLLAGSGLAFAHVTLETQQASAPSTYKAVFRVPHGCGDSPTVKIRVQVPEGVIAVKPMPKPGWQLETVKAKYAKSYDYYGTAMSEGVKEVVWSGGKLLDEHYDEFVFRSYLTNALKAGEVLYFPVVQECERGVQHWTDTSNSSHVHDEHKGTAPSVTLVPKP